MSRAEEQPDSLKDVTLDETAVAAARLQQNLPQSHAPVEALYLKEPQYQTLIEAIPHLVWVTTAEGMPEYFNQRWRDYTAFAVTADLEFNWNYLLHPEDRAAAAAAWMSAVKTREPYEVEYRLRRYDGVYRWFLVRGVPLRDATEQIVRWFGTCTDIDRQKRAAEKQRFLARLSNETRTLAAPDEIMWTTLQMLGEHLRASRSTYNDVDEDHDRITVHRDYCTEGESLLGTIPLSALGSALLDEFRIGRIAIVADAATDPRTAPAFETTYRPIGIGSFIAAPLIKGGKLVTVLSVNMLAARAWTQEEAELVEEVAERTWLAVQNAREAQERQRAEAALRASETRFRMLVDQAPLSIQILANDGRTLRVNRAWEQLWGVTLDDLHDYNMLQDTQLVEKGVMPYIRRAFEGEPVVIPAVLYDPEQTLPNRTRNSEPGRWTRAVMYPVKDEAGNVREVVLIHEDITEQVRAREEQARLTVEVTNQRQRLDDLVSSVPGVVWEAWGQPDHGNQRINYVSDHVEAMLGYTVEEWVSTPNFWLTIVHPDDRERAVQSAMEAWTSGRQHVNEFRWITRDGRALWCESHSVVVKDGQGAPIGMRGVTIDVSRRKQFETRLREETKTLETIHDVGQRLSAELDLEKMVQAATDAATELTGAQFGAFFYNVVNSAGETYMLYTLSGVPREAFSGFPMPRKTAVFAPTFAGESTVRLDDVTRDPRYGKSFPYYGKPPGHLPVVSYLAVPVVSRTGEVLGGLFFGHEQPGVFSPRHERIVEGLAAQAAIAIDNARLFQAERERSEQLAMAIKEVHHRVKNSLQGVSALLEMQIVPNAATLPVEAIWDSLSQIKTIALVHDLLAHDQPIGKVDAAQVLNRLVSMLSAMLGTPELPVHIGLEAESLWVPIKAATALALIVNELVTNAAKHSVPKSAKDPLQPDAAVEVSLQRQQAEVLVSVQDRGPGFPPDFDPVLHAHIGLELVQALVSNDLKGSISFRNAAGERATGQPDERGARIEIRFFPDRLFD